MMAITPRKVRIVMGLVEQDPSTKALVVPAGAQIYNSDKTTVSTIYSDTSGTALANPVPTGVAVGAAGLDTYGNLIIYGDDGTDYFALVNSVFVPLPVTGIHGADFTDHVGVTGAVADPHGDRADAAANYLPISGAGVAGGTATLDSDGLITSTQLVCR